MATSRNIAIGILTALLFGISVYSLAFAQEEAPELPVLRLDRIPSPPAFAGQTRAPAAGKSAFSVETLVGGLEQPWSLAFLPRGEILINEYSGNMRIVDLGGRLSAPLRGLPEISHEGWAGLFDVTIDPQFPTNRLVYFSYTGKAAGADGRNVPRVARARLDRDQLRLVDVEIIVDGFGSQEIHFSSDGKLLVSGAGDSANDDPQDLGSYYGKLLRLNADGSLPDDNPWSRDAQVAPGAYTLGHRDVSGMANHPATGELWITEHGPRGGDELNRIRAGANYGWNVISYGTEYTGAPIGNGGTVLEGMEQPRYFWRPSIAPSGLVFYSGDMFPEWQGNLFVTSLSGMHLARLEFNGDRVVAEERLLVARAARIREARVGPDGALYLLTNAGDGESSELLRLYRD